MKCPYRKIKTESFENEGGLATPVTKEEFAECYGTECPFYQPEYQLSKSNLKVSEGCKRVAIDEINANKKEKQNAI